jgi:hypothetical protein
MNFWLQGNFFVLSEAGFDLGGIDHSLITARVMNKYIAQMGRGKFRAFLTTINLLTNKLPHVGGAAEKLTDLSGKRSQVAMLRLNNKGIPLTIFAKNKVLAVGDYS